MWYFESGFPPFLDSIPQIISFLTQNNINAAKLRMKSKRKQMANTVLITLLTVSSDFPDRDIRAGMQISTCPHFLS